MAKVTSKRQVTVPKALADRYGIEPGAELEWQPAGDVIRVIPPGRVPPSHSVETRLAVFDASTERQLTRQKEVSGDRPGPPGRGWTRADLYDDRGPR